MQNIKADRAQTAPFTAKWSEILDLMGLDAGDDKPESAKKGAGSSKGVEGESALLKGSDLLNGGRAEVSRSGCS